MLLLLPDELIEHVIEMCDSSNSILNLAQTCSFLAGMCKTVTRDKIKGVQFFYSPLEYFVMKDQHHHYYYLDNSYRFSRIPFLFPVNTIEVRFCTYGDKIKVIYRTNKRRLYAVDGKINKVGRISLLGESQLIYRKVTSFRTLGDYLFILTKRTFVSSLVFAKTPYHVIRKPIKERFVTFLSTSAILGQSGQIYMFDQDFNGAFMFWPKGTTDVLIENGDLSLPIGNQHYLYLKDGGLFNVKHEQIDSNENYRRLFQFKNLILVFTSNYQLIGKTINQKQQITKSKLTITF